MSIDPTASRLASQGVAFAPQIAAAAKRYGLAPELLAAVAAQETGGPDTNAGHNEVGDGGHGRGLFQIDNRWHSFASTPDAMDPGKNADYAAGMLSGLLKEYGGNVHEALSAYNSGSPTAAGTSTRWADGSDLAYADSVLRHERLLTGVAAAQSLQTSPVAESPHASAVAESSDALASIARLCDQAQNFPLIPPAIADPSDARAYRHHATDYLEMLDDTNENDS